MARTEEQIEARTIPGHSFITLGGRDYAALEPPNARARVIRRALADYERARLEAGKNSAEQVEILETMMDTCIRAFSSEIESDWERIHETATDRERLEAMLAIRDSVMVPFTTLAAAVQPVENRKTRRAKK